MAISFKGAHFPKEVILMGVRWYVAYPLSTRHVEELMEERGVDVDHSTINRWVIKYTRLGGLSPMKEREEYRIKTELFGMDLVSPFTAIACVCQLRGSPEKALTPAGQSCLDSP